MPTSPGNVPRLIFLLLSTAALGACSVDTSVSMTGATAARVQHMFVTVTEVWLSTNPNAAATDSGWVGSVLATPVTVDISNLSDGSMQTLLSGIKTPAGTYRQLRLVVENSSASLSTAAQAAGLTSNAEVQYLDASNNSITAPLELASPTSQLILPLSVVLNSPATAQLSQSGTSTPAAVPTATLAVNLESNRNLLLFTYGTQTGAILDAAGTVADAAKVGGISGTVDVSSIPATTLTGPQGILVTAEKLSDDGSRYQVLKSVSLQSSGAFTLYPLPVADTGTTTYDVVIHGPGIRTVIITKIPVTSGAPSASTAVQSDAISLANATDYTVNTAANSIALPGGSRARFYQTLPGDSVPHLIEYALIDPFTGGFDADLSLSADAVDFGAYANGSSVSFTTSAPGEGIGSYRMAAEAPLRPFNPLTTTISAPTTLPASVQPIFLPQLPTLSSAASIAGSITSVRPGRFDNGFLLVSRGGEIIESHDLHADLAAATTNSSFSINFGLSGIPAAIDDARYDVSVRLWNSTDPAGSLTRAAASSPADLSKGSVSGILIPIL